MLIRLLQNFSSISLDAVAQPPDTRPPTHWAGAEGRKGTEEFWPMMHLTMYANVGLTSNHDPGNQHLSVIFSRADYGLRWMRKKKLNDRFVCGRVYNQLDE